MYMILILFDLFERAKFSAVSLACLQLCGNPMAVDLFSRNARVQNNSTVGTMIVEAIRCPAGSEVIRIKIPPEKHEYIRYSDFHIEYNKCDIAVYVYLEGASGSEKKSLLPSMIRDNEKIELNYIEGRVTVSPIKGSMIAMNGLVIKLKHASKMFKSLWK
ncbi:uncharacterized protein LOC132166498 isoform X2 [Corylus avellana]|uniref:uncharacterized protein LOC132166498 isoform X2 n=1 Tax=Corylus avellana TaxID=13451 RepID=UPI00286A464B|nr:uncharacterized protein LOC132166498 isoform X2 [Corylus avellana]